MKMSVRQRMILCAAFLVLPVLASADEIVKDQLIKEAGGKSEALVPPFVVKDTKQEVVFPPKPGVRLSALQLERLLDLARYVHDNKPNGIQKGSFTTHCFTVEGHYAADGYFRLESIWLWRAGGDDYYTFLVDPDGVVHKASSARNEPLSKESADIAMKEVSLWVEYQTKRFGRYPPNHIPEPLGAEPATP